MENKLDVNNQETQRLTPEEMANNLKKRSFRNMTPEERKQMSINYNKMQRRRFILKCFCCPCLLVYRIFEAI